MCPQDLIFELQHFCVEQTCTRRSSVKRVPWHEPPTQCCCHIDRARYRRYLVSPPASDANPLPWTSTNVGTRGIAGDQGATRWRLDRCSLGATEARRCTRTFTSFDENATSRIGVGREGARVRTCRSGQARCARHRWRPWTAIRAPGSERRANGPLAASDWHSAASKN